MKKVLLTAVAAALSASAAFGAHNVIPAPRSLTPADGAFTFTAEEAVAIPQYAGDSILNAFTTMQFALEKAAGAKLTPGADGRIAMRIDPALAAEAYKLDVTADSIILAASRPVGFFYGMQTLQQLLPVGTRQPATVEAVAIEDEPRFGWRGFMLDESRHFFGKEAAKRVIDILALYKMNRFHWHLTDDQGWRLEIKAYPQLTEYGSKRVGNRLGAWGRKYQPDNYVYDPGYYTQDDIREVVDYARQHFIEIVPEIDLPGHTQAAVASYPELLACNPDTVYKVWEWMGVSPDVINVAKPEAVKFTNDVLDELTELFPFGYIHLGGDECPTSEWQKAPDCQARLKEIGSDNYRDLQLDYYNKLVDHLRSQGKDHKLIFWNEVLHGNTDLIGLPADDVVIMSWVDFEKAGADAANRGMWTIMSPIIPWYINRVQSTDPYEPEGAGNGTDNLEKVYAYEPLGSAPAGKEDRYMGVQGNFWTEWVDSESLLQYLMLPRLAAIAERGWSDADRRDYSDFTSRIRGWHTPYYTSKGYNHGRNF